MSRRVVSLGSPAGTGNRAARAADKRQLRLTTDKLGTVVLPWWPDEIAWSGMAATYAEQERPGRRPLLLRQAVGLEELRVGTVVRTRDLEEDSPANERARADATSIAEILETLRLMSRSVKPVTVSLAGRSAKYRITDLGITEIEWAATGQPLVAEVSMTLLEASDAAIPIGPIKRPKR